MSRSIAVFLLVLLMPLSAFGGDLANLFPEKAGDLTRIQLVVGPDAQAEVDQLHGKALPAKASAIGRYIRPKEMGKIRPAEVWVSQVESADEARRQIGVMVHKMYDNPKSPFKNPKRLDKKGHSVFRFTGMGQVHLLWHTGDLAYWVSAQPSDEATLLDVFCQ